MQVQVQVHVQVQCRVVSGIRSNARSNDDGSDRRHAALHSHDSKRKDHRRPLQTVPTKTVMRVRPGMSHNLQAPLAGSLRGQGMRSVPHPPSSKLPVEFLSETPVSSRLQRHLPPDDSRREKIACNRADTHPRRRRIAQSRRPQARARAGSWPGWAAPHGRVGVAAVATCPLPLHETRRHQDGYQLCFNSKHDDKTGPCAARTSLDEQRAPQRRRRRTISALHPT